MNASRRGGTTAFAALVLALGLAACGSDHDEGSASEGPDSPLGDLFGWTDYDPVEQRRQQLAIEEAVAACMREEGFEYTPVDYDAQFSSGETDEDIALYSDPEAYGKKYGYGVVRNYELYEEPYIGEDGEGGPPPFEDPNQDYINSLSPDEQNAYNTALHGDWSAPAETIAEESTFDDGELDDGATEENFYAPPLEEQGCYGKATADVVGDDPANDPEVQEAMNDMFTRLEEDPRIDQASTEWAECMEDTGEDIELPADMTLDSPDTMYQVMESKKAEAAGRRVLPLDPNTGEPVGDYDPNAGYESFGTEDGEFAVVGERKAIPADELERLRSFELKLWATDWECQEEVGMAELRATIEQEMVDDLIAQFPDLAADE